MSVESLKCKECGADVPARRQLRLRAAASARSRSPTTSPASTRRRRKRRIQAGSQGIWRYADFLPFDGRPGDPLEPGLTPLIRADRLAERLGLEAELWIKNDAANPTHSFKDRVVAVAVAKAQELGFETVACASTGNLANAVAAHAAAAGLDSYVFVPADLEEQKLLATGVYGTNLVGVRGNYDDVNRLCTAARRDAALGLRQRQPAPLLRRGLEDARLRDRRAARLGAARPGRLRRSPPARCSPSSAAASRSGSSSAWSRASCRSSTAPRPQGCSPVATAFAEGWDVCKPQQPDTIAKSLAIGDPADGPYALELARAAPAASIDVGHRRRDPRRDPPARRDDRHLHRDRRRRHRRRARASSPSAARSAPASGSSSTSPARG